MPQIIHNYPHFVYRNKIRKNHHNFLKKPKKNAIIYMFVGMLKTKGLCHGSGNG